MWQLDASTQFAEHVLLTIKESWIEKKNGGASPLILPDGPYFSAVKEFLNDPETLVRQAWKDKVLSLIGGLLKLKRCKKYC